MGGGGEHRRARELSIRENKGLVEGKLAGREKEGTPLTTKNRKFNKRNKRKKEKENRNKV